MLYEMAIAKYREIVLNSIRNFTLSEKEQGFMNYVHTNCYAGAVPASTVTPAKFVQEKIEQMYKALFV